MRIGVDEAGKGPVLGPMVCAAVGVPDPEILPEGVADSKRLTPARREELDAAIREDERISVGVAAVEVDCIDDPETDMNRLTVAGQAEATSSLLADGVVADGGSVEDGRVEGDCGEWSVLADAGDTSESRFARRLEGSIEVGDGGSPAEISVEARHGADDEDPVVAAASIVAKVERDSRVQAIAEEYGDVGSGYPGDQTTRDFLERFVREKGELPGCARASWSTCDDVLASVEQAGLGEY